MQRVELSSLFFDLLEVVQTFVPEADHESMVDTLVSSLIDNGYDVSDLYHHDEVVDRILDAYLGDEEEEDEYDE